MVQESRLVISIDARNAEKSAKDLADKLKDLTQAGNNASNKSKQLGTTINQTNQITQNFNTTVNNNSRAIERNTGVVNANSNALKTLAMYMGSIVTLGEAVSKMDAWTGLQNRLKLVTQSQQELNQATQDTFAISQKTGSAWGNTVQVYQRFSDNAKTLGINMQQTARLTETVSKAVAISGATVQGAEGALIQFGQALAADRLSGEELNSVMEQTPALAKAIAEGMGLTIGQLRGVAKEGKITGAVMVDALTKMANKVDEQFGRTQMTISQSLVTLDNALIMLADGSTGASTAIGSAIQTISTNLELISSVAIVGGIMLLTKAIGAKSMALTASASAILAERTATLASAQANATATATEASRTLVLKELVAMQLADAQATMARMTGLQRLAYLQTTVLPLEARLTQATLAHTTAVNADTVAQNANNTARSRGAMVFGALGGGLGMLTLGVGALATGYMILSNNAEKANEKLAEQAKIADKTKEELQALNGAQKESAKKDLAEVFKAQNKELERRSNIVEATIAEIASMNTADAETAKILREVRAGTMSYDEALTTLNQSKKNMPDIIKRLTSETNSYEEQRLIIGKNADAQKNLGVQVKLAGNEAQNSSSKYDDLADSLDGAEGSAKKLNKELENLKKTQADRKFDAIFLNYVMKTGNYTEQQAKDILELQRAKGLNNRLIVDDIKLTTEAWKAEKELDKTRDEIAKKEKAIADELKKQNKEREKGTKLSALVLANAKKYNFAEKEQRYNLPPNIISAIQQQESGGHTYTKSGKLLTSPKGAQGSSQFMPKTAKRFNVDVRSVDSSAEGTAKYLRYLLNKFNGDLDKAIMSYNAGEGNVASGKAYSFRETQNYLKKVKGYMGGSGASEYTSQWESAEKDKQKLQEESAQRQADIDYKYATSKVQREAELQRELLYLRQNGREKEADLAQRFFDENEKLINMQNVYSLSEHKLTEEQKLGFNRRINEQIIISNREMGLQEKKDKLNALNEVFEYEKSILKSITDQRQSEYDKLYMNESQLVLQRYADEIREAQKIKDIDEKNHVARMANARREIEIQEILNNARTGWRQYDVSNDNPYASIEAEQATKSQASNALLESEILHLENQNKLNEMADFNERMAKIQQDGADRINKINEDASKARLDLNLASAQGIAGSMSDMFKSMIGEQSTAYKVMFATEKAFNIARSLVAVKTAIALASAQPFPMNLGAMATVAGLTANIVSDIMAIGSNGFKSGGYTGNGGVSDVAGVVHGKEFVLNASTTRRIGVDNLNAVNNGGDLQAVQQAQSSRATAQSPQAIDNNVKVIMVRDENEAKDMLYSSDAEKAFLYHMKRNRGKI